VIRLFAITYIGLAAVLYTFQTSVIFPGASTQGQPYSQVQPRPGTELVRLRTARGEEVVALFGPALTALGEPNPEPDRRPILIYFYGNAMCLSDSLSVVEQFRRLGLNVIAPDYLGYGMSGGRPSEQGCQETADAVYDYLISTRRIDRAKIIATGWSLGGAVAIDLARRRPVAALMVFSTFTRVADLGRRVLPFLPVSLLLHHRFESATKIPHVGCPILIGHGRRDRIIPFAMAEQLAAAARSPVTKLWVAEADHNDFFHVAGRRIDDAVSEFVSRHFGH
jgi:fermentation-respiration switch protein FrsA (DUF1100 family)